jgi:hypothetical protein
MGLATVQSGNVSQAMQLALVRSADYWNWYQSDKIRHEIGRYALIQSEGLAETLEPERAARLQPKLAEMRAQLERGAGKMEASRANAERHDVALQKLSQRDDQLDLAEAAFSIAMALLAMASLTLRRWLFRLALVPVFLGLVTGLASFL